MCQIINVNIVYAALHMLNAINIVHYQVDVFRKHITPYTKIILVAYSLKLI